MTLVRVNVEMRKEVAIKWKQASSIELSAYCLQILREIRCSSKKLPINRKTGQQQLTAITVNRPHHLGHNNVVPQMMRFK